MFWMPFRGECVTFNTLWRLCLRDADELSDALKTFARAQKKETEWSDENRDSHLLIFWRFEQFTVLCFL